MSFARRTGALPVAAALSLAVVSATGAPKRVQTDAYDGESFAKIFEQAVGR